MADDQQPDTRLITRQRADRRQQREHLARLRFEAGEAALRLTEDLIRKRPRLLDELVDAGKIEQDDLKKLYEYNGISFDAHEA